MSTVCQSVMLIDDNEIDNLINQKILESLGYCENIYVHTSAKSALEFLKNLEKLGQKNVNNLLPQIIFLDIDMPILDGFQFLNEYEKLSDNVKEYCKIIMLTSSLNMNDVSKAEQHKYVKKYINKPLSRETLSKLSV